MRPVSPVVLALLLTACAGVDREEASASGGGFTTMGNDTAGLTGTDGDGGLTSITSTGGDDTGDDSGGGTLFDAGVPDTTGGDGGICNCAPKSDLIYLLAYDPAGPGSIWTFDPESGVFTEEVPLNCPTGLLDMVFSMGVSRDGKAWIEMQPSQKLFKVDVNTGACEDTGFLGHPSIESFGMAFVSESQANPCDDLHVLEGSTSAQTTECPGQGCGRLGFIDEASMSIQTVGEVDYFGGELTGTGDGRLFAFLGSSPAKLVQFDKDAGEAIESWPLAGLETTDAFAFAFWGGDFYFFTEANDTLPGYPEGTSKVTRLDFDGNEDGGLKVINSNAPILVAGAGVSTCAPFVPPG